MSAKYQQHPMEEKFHQDQAAYRKAKVAVDAAYAALIEQTSMEDTRDNRLAFGVGYAQGKYDAGQAEPEQPPKAQPFPMALRGDGPCDDCGTPDNIVWFAESDLWNRVIRDGEETDKILCVPCFVVRAMKKYPQIIAWKMVPEARPESRVPGSFFPTEQPPKAPEGEAGALERIAGGLDLEGAKRFVAEKNWVPKSYFLSMAAEIDALRAEVKALKTERREAWRALEDLPIDGITLADGIYKALADAAHAVKAGAAVPAREALIPELYCIALGYEMRPGEFEEAKKDKGWMEYWNKQADRILALLPTKASEGTVPQGGPARDALEKLAKVALKVAESAKGPKVVHDISIFDLADLEKLALAALLGAGGDALAEGGG